MTSIAATDDLTDGHEAAAARPAGWGRFFGLTLPACLLGLALAAEGAAYALRGIQPLRTSLDSIAAAASQAPGHARWLVFGDSLTQHILMDYSAGPQDRVINLTTHAGAGTPSMYLLLRRYLANHPAPRGIVMVVSPDVLANVPDAQNGRFWLVPTFGQPEEQAWLSQFYPSAHVRSWRPAAADLKHAVFDPLTGLFGNRHPHFAVAPHVPSDTVPLEPALPLSAESQAVLEARAARRLALGTSASVISDICHVARGAGIDVRVLMAPMPATLRAAWMARGELPQFEKDVSDVLHRDCGAARFDDMSAALQPPNFDEAGTHIEGTGWQNRFAAWLSAYIARADKA